jgi:ABC-2 type transport system permease protein
MNGPANGVRESSVDSRAAAPAALSATRPLYWSVRRELWEHRSIWVAPLVVASVLLLGFAIAAIRLPERRRAVLLLDEARQRASIGMPYDVAAMVLIMTGFVVGVFYCLEALHGERRDRSILFWKSLPVSDLTTVLSKACVPLVILPLLTFVAIIATHLLMLALSTVILLASGLGGAAIGATPRFMPSPLAVLYAMPVTALWYAPIYGWMLLMSGWARRATFLWAVLPIFAIAVLERIAFGTAYFIHLVRWRAFGCFIQAFAFDAHGRAAIGSVLAELTPGRFLATPGLWLGLVVAAAFLAAAVWSRRCRGPI